jgi:hypothetical protein
MILKFFMANSFLILRKRARGVIQVVEYLPSKGKAQSSILNATKTNKILQKVTSRLKMWIKP